MMLRTEELREQILKDTRIFHFGTLSMTDEPVRSATRHAIETAKANGALLSFDPNIREPLWQSMEEAKRQTAYGMEVCDVLKISDNEIRWFTGEKDFDRGVDKLWREYHIPLILLSMGSGGSRAYCGSRRAEQPAFLQESTIETTGAGDTFGAHFVPEKSIWATPFQVSLCRYSISFLAAMLSGRLVSRMRQISRSGIGSTRRMGSTSPRAIGSEASASG